MTRGRTLGGLGAVAALIGVMYFATRSPEPSPAPPPEAPASAPTAEADTRPAKAEGESPERRPERVAPRPAPEAPSDGGVASAQPAPGVAPTHDPSAPPEDVQRVERAFEEWVLAPVNRHANARVLGADCKLSICTLGVLYDGISDSGFFTRAERWFEAQPGPGRPMTYPHRVDAHTFKVWYFWSPHEEGTPENHRFVEAVTERIQAEIGAPPEDPYHYVH